MPSKEDALVEFPQEKWPDLVNYYKENYTKGVTGYHVMTTQIINKKNYPDFPVGVYTAYGDFHDGVVVVFSVTEYSLDLMVLIIKDDYSILKKALCETQRVDWRKKMTFSMVRPEVTPCLAEVFEVLHLKHRAIRINMVQMPHTDIEKLDLMLPPDVYVDALNTQHANIVDEVYTHKNNKSVKYFEYMIEHKFGIGLFGKDDKILRAWIFTSPKGELHALQVKEEYARKGYAKFLIKYMSKIVADQGRIVLSGVIETNKPSMKLFTDLGFKPLCPIDWIILIH